MSFTIDDLLICMLRRENEHLEFKEAKSSFEFDEVLKYSVALANEKGGELILGVTNTIPRKVVGSAAFQDIERIKHSLTEKLHLRAEVEVVQHPDGRVLRFSVPSRPIGMPLQYKGAYWMRSGESLVPMTPDQIKRILDESGPDYSAELCPHADLGDLDPAAIIRFRDMWRRKSGNAALDDLPIEHLLSDAELLTNGKMTYASLILLGTNKALGKYLPHAETVFEYRSSEGSISYQQRKDYRQGFFLYDDDVWSTINLRNEVQHYQDGLFVWDISTFNETVVREAILNAICHRDYRLQGSIFVRQYPKHIEINSPGGFPPGVTPSNILDHQFPRNRRIAEALSKCGLVERSGQGADRMFVESIKESKPRPDFSGTDDYRVVLTLRGEVQNPRFLKFLEQITREGMGSFTTQDLVVLDSIQRDEPVPNESRDRLSTLQERGVIEQTSRGKGAKYILSRRFYAFLGKQGTYTRKRGLDRAYSKALLLGHIEDSLKTGGAALRELQQVLPDHTRDQVQKLLKDLKRAEKIYLEGKANAARWLPSPMPESRA